LELEEKEEWKENSTILSPQNLLITLEKLLKSS
jgi:hypothetical protein